MKKKFKIKHIDSLAQGFSSLDDELIFIPRTLPSEEGLCEITAKKGRVQFGKLISLEKSSPERITPACPHYEDCSGCDYLHTQYENEMKFKQDALKDIFLRQHRFANIPDIKIHEGPYREGYRNRIQLHYDKKKKVIGFKSYDHSIVPVNQCLVPNDDIQTKLKELYENNSWLELVKKEKPKGHIELYFKDRELNININKYYAAEGFSQVNEAMNDKLHELLSDYFSKNKSEEIVDLFGGAGNITKNATSERILVVDSTDKKFIKLQNDKQEYYQINLYHRNSLADLKKLEFKTGQTLVLDPPRSGLKNIDSFTQEINPNSILYVSCNPQTLARDLKKIEDQYLLEDLYLLDFFPGTKHFETVAIMNRK